MKTLLTICLIISGCGYWSKEHDQKPHQSPVEELRAMHYQIFSEVSAQLDITTGWPAVNDCDGTLWAGIGCAAGLPVKITFAEYSPGEIHRRPYKACWSDETGDQGSKTTISRDMLTGYMACIWATKDLDAFKRLAAYGEARNWIMGAPSWYLSRVLLTANGQNAIGNAIFALSGGSDDRLYRHYPTSYPRVGEDYEKHVQVQGILLADRIDNGVPTVKAINEEMLTRLKENAAEFPNDFLFAAALGRFTGDQSRTLELLRAFDTKAPKCSGYVRGENPAVYCKIIWLQAAGIVLEGAEN